MLRRMRGIVREQALTVSPKWDTLVRDARARHVVLVRIAAATRTTMIITYTSI
jgi:hypothetical protein